MAETLSLLRRIHLLGQDLMLMDDGKIMRNHCLAQENTLVMNRALPIDLIIASKKINMLEKI